MRSFKIYQWTSEAAQSCPTPCNPMDCSLPGSSIHGIFQARVLEWVALSLSRISSRPKDQTQVSCIAGRQFAVWATGEAQDQGFRIYSRAHQHDPPPLLPHPVLASNRTALEPHQEGPAGSARHSRATTSVSTSLVLLSGLHSQMLTSSSSWHWKWATASVRNKVAQKKQCTKTVLAMHPPEGQGLVVVYRVGTFF